jgi:hypothetical protein
MWTKLSDSIRGCLGFKDLIEGLSDLEFYRVFKIKILSPLDDVGGKV